MDAGELLWRIRSLLRDQVDLARVPLALTPGLRAARRETCAAFRPGFSCTPANKDLWLSVPMDTRATWETALVEKANATLENRLSYFELENEFHGDPWNWHRDFSAGKDCPVRLSILTDYRDFDTYGDCKLVWEPNRHHQLVVLARAYAVKGDARYAGKIAELLSSWIEANPFGYGMNWKSPLELAVRLINWIWAIDLIRESGAIDDTLWHAIQETVYRSTWDIQRKYSRGSSANNHLIGELAGVYIASCYFNGMPAADTWRKTSKRKLEEEIIRQTYADGCTREHAFNYQFFVIQFFTLALLAGRSFGDSFSSSFVDRLHEMYRFMKDLSCDTGRPPNVGDADDGYVLDLGGLPDKPLSLLAVGSALFGDKSLAHRNASETAFWLLGDYACEKRTSFPEEESSFYPECGYHLLRSKRHEDANRPGMTVFVDCAELGYGPIAAHGHADCLSICLSVDGKPVLIDPGTFDYFTSPDWRDYFRQTCAHNTVEIDGKSQSVSLGPFMWGARATARLIESRSNSEEDVLVGEHDGYMDSDSRVLHRRTLRLDKRTPSLSVRDTLTSGDACDARAFFHLAPGYEARLNDDGATISGHGLRLRLKALDGEVRCGSGNEHSMMGWVSDRYHVREKAQYIVISRRILGSDDLAVEITVEQ
jgi:hypothetical protein